MSIWLPNGTQNNHTSLPLTTKKGWRIPNTVNPELTPFFLNGADTRAMQGKLNCILRRRVTGTYNCLGMVFASRRTSIDPMYLEKILQDDDYRQLGSENDLVVGDLVVYRYQQPPRQAAHVAIVVAKPLVGAADSKTRVLSKWGDKAGEFFHDIDVIPDGCGQLSEFWTDRP